MHTASEMTCRYFYVDLSRIKSLGDVKPKDSPSVLLKFLPLSSYSDSLIKRLILNPPIQTSLDAKGGNKKHFPFFTETCLAQLFNEEECRKKLCHSPVINTYPLLFVLIYILSDIYS